MADPKGLVFLEFKNQQIKEVDSGVGKLSQYQGVTHFVEYDINHFFVTCKVHTHFFVIHRAEKKKIPIQSISFEKSPTVGIYMMPLFDTDFALVRNTRGIQIIDIKDYKAHQLCMSTLPSLELDEIETMTNMLHLYLDEDTWQYTISTIYQWDE